MRYYYCFRHVPGLITKVSSSMEDQSSEYLVTTCALLHFRARAAIKNQGVLNNVT
jgi:hypothetical protein